MSVRPVKSQSGKYCSIDRRRNPDHAKADDIYDLGTIKRRHPKSVDNRIGIADLHPLIITNSCYSDQTKSETMSTRAGPSEGIEHLLHAETEFYAPASLIAQLRLKDYAAEYRRSVEDAEGFWAGVAEELEWFQPWKKVFDWKYPTFEWFSGRKVQHHLQLPRSSSQSRAQE
jgi:Acetyl-coenzyme A synthetase N-terminus